MSSPTLQTPEPSSLFPTTLWTVLVDPVRRGDEDGTRALNDLCRRYWLPIFTYVRSRGHDHHQAEELAQDFLAALIRRGSFQGLDREKGRFRAFLLVCLKNFLISQHEHKRAKKRGGGFDPCSLDELVDSVAYSVAPSDEVLFDRPWAETLLREALIRTEGEYQGAGKKESFEELRCFLTTGEPLKDRHEIALKRGVEVGAVDVAIHRLRRRFGAILRALVAETVDSAEGLDAEMEYLISVISA